MICKNVTLQKKSKDEGKVRWIYFCVAQVIPLATMSRNSLVDTV